MEDHSLPLILFISLILVLSECAAHDTISANQEIKDGETIVSQGEMFEMGFFSPGNSKNRYLGIWYKKISTGTVVWVANRETPITDKLGFFKVTKDGNLLILKGGGNTVAWSSNSTASGNGNAPVVEVQLLDTGNLVVWDKKKDTNRNLIWQSFDYPGDTFLPGMKFGKDFVTGIEWCMTSWKSPDDPAPGLYHDLVNTNGYPQIFGWRGKELLTRLGPWNGVGFNGFGIDIPNPIYSLEFVVNEKEIYHKYELKSSVIMRVVLTWEGKTEILHWIERIQEWLVYADASVDSCGRFALCGPYGSCSINTHPPCGCMEGFEPKNQQQWDASDWSSGCKRKKALNCGNTDGFRKIAGGVKVPDTRKSYYNVSMSLGECEMTCKRDCSCTAYASLDISNGGSGCLLWFHELMDTREYDSKQDLYLKMAASELQGQVVQHAGPNERNVLVIVFLLMSLFLLLPALAYASRKMKKRNYMKRRGNNGYVLDEKKTSLRMELLDNLQFFNLTEVERATDNFNVSNKIGEGGFGPVYKGVLEDGQEVAVKRLSETSQQGLDEFKNELTCIAKLQHRNLVKLLGYCVHEYELILIYEYMPNNSLDFFLFDKERSLMLDWPKRFVIIHGMARGILYLHQDSRLQIIHRDLKAGNILLDSNMNPKISDFGLARKFVGHDDIAKTKKVVGTYGYISPEYAVHGRFSIKSDVFSFGVLVLEIICGKKNREFTHENHGDNLLGHAWRLYKENKGTELICESLRASCIVSEVLRSIHVALLCVQHHAEDRPTMLSVVLMLVSESKLPEPKQPAFFTDEYFHGHKSFSSVDKQTITILYGR
ncbi:G-type lectin S-receptor-like serine/threonine-protein kinase At4g27290 isoform X2 [Rutidosis leptorrhynchoides]|uniref:G-type lectin S-receptor-like serine/threonine-protein kinase At4g27290 isoform X2 n=1 Tax=Rutidosis leptorrhynchoides TaxID=125765 RepID=UPI003A995E2A